MRLDEAIRAAGEGGALWHRDWPGPAFITDGKIRFVGPMMDGLLRDIETLTSEYWEARPKRREVWICYEHNLEYVSVQKQKCHPQAVRFVEAEE